MAIEDEFCTLSELADGMAAATVAKYARPPGEVLTCQSSDGAIDTMDASENIRIVSRQNALLEIFRLIQQGDIVPLNMSLMPAAQPVPYEYFDRRLIRREQAAQILQRLFGTAPEAQPQAAAPEQQLDYSMLATPGQLIAAFGAMSGMNKGWFRSLKDRRGLHEAVRVPGVRGRNGQPPLLDVFAVLQYLIDPGRTGKKMLPGTGWRLLKSHFPQVYAMYAGFDPDNSN